MLVLAILALLLHVLYVLDFNMQINYCCDSSISIYQNNRYFRHASGEMFVISRAVAQFISINRFATLYCA